MAGRIGVGIGGWTFPPWRGDFYPAGVRQKDELSFASRQLSAIEINGTYHSLQSPKSFAKWASETPDGFLFTLKGSRFCTNRRVLAETGPGVDRFLGQGLTELGAKLGPILWQFMANKAFDPVDFAAFLDLLPHRLGDRDLRHCVEVRNPSFVEPAFVDLCRDRGVAICRSEDDRWPMISEVTADFTYSRLMKGSNAEATGYPAAGIADWAERLQADSRAGMDAFAFFISGGKVRAPAAAQALIARIESA